MGKWAPAPTARHDRGLRLQLSAPRGAGSFATVFKCVERSTGKDWALKEILKSSISTHELEDLKVRPRPRIASERAVACVACFLA